MSRKTINTVYLFITRTRTNTLASALYLLGILCFALIPTLSSWFGSAGHDFSFALACIFWGITGILYIARQEVDLGFLLIQGPIAIIIGFMIIILGLVLALTPFIN